MVVEYRGSSISKQLLWDVISKRVQKLNYQGIVKADGKYNPKIFFEKDKQNIKKPEICIGNKVMGAELLFNINPPIRRYMQYIFFGEEEENLVNGDALLEENDEYANKE